MQFGGRGELTSGITAFIDCIAVFFAMPLYVLLIVLLFFGFCIQDEHQ